MGLYLEIINDLLNFFLNENTILFLKRASSIEYKMLLKQSGQYFFIFQILK